jgi:hypothetical protein
VEIDGLGKIDPGIVLIDLNAIRDRHSPRGCSDHTKAQQKKTEAEFTRPKAVTHD